MGLAIKPTVSCNLGCTYCYENSIRSAGNAGTAHGYDMEKMTAQVIAQIDRTHTPLTLHGGEALLMKKEDLETMMKLSFERTGKVSIQTNGELIDEDHISLFKRYKVSVGISMDGFGECNIARWKGSREATLKYTEDLWDTIVRLRKEGISVGIITVISRKNGLPEQRESMKHFVRELKRVGVSTGRFNPVETDFPELKEEFELTNEELTDFYLDMADFTMNEGTHWMPFRDIVDSLMGLRLGTCVYTQCDWYHTKGEEAILSDGSMGGCLKTAKDGVMFLRDEYGTSDERYQILRQIPKEEGGCGGCPFWTICSGICPAENDDWREKSKYCGAFYALYSYFHKRLKDLIPNITLSPEMGDNAIGNLGHAYSKVVIAKSSWAQPKIRPQIPARIREGDDLLALLPAEEEELGNESK